MAQLTFPRIKWGEVESLAASLFIAHKILFRKHIGCETQNAYVLINALEKGVPVCAVDLYSQEQPK